MADGPLPAPPARRTRVGIRRSTAPLEIRRLGLSPDEPFVDYEQAYALQHELAAQRASGELDHDVVLLLQHESIYTAGKRTEDADRPVNGARVIDVDRGGRITWHGPGQLVGYPIIALAEPLDVVEYVRRIEEMLISCCADHGLTTGRVAGRSGVWVCDDAGERKLGQIGIRVSRGVTLHGFALNVDPDLSVFSAIVPCGIADAGVTSLVTETGVPANAAQLADTVEKHLTRCLDEQLPQEEHTENTSVGSIQ